MQDLKKTKILLYDSADPGYIDLTEDAFDLSQDSVDLAMVQADFLYLGRYKPFSAIYLEADPDQPNTVAGAFTAQYWNKDTAAWTALPLLVEDTRAAARSGFIKWTAPSAWGTTEIESEGLFWLRLAPTADQLGSCKARGLNLVYATDADLKREDFGIMALLPKDAEAVSAKSHVLSHIAARDAIVQELRRRGKIKTSAETYLPEDLNEWDLLDIGQVRQAAIYKALSKIYLGASNAKDDVNWAKHELAEANYQSAFELILLALDADDDGVKDTVELVQDAGGTFRRG